MRAASAEAQPPAALSTCSWSGSSTRTTPSGTVTPDLTAQVRLSLGRSRERETTQRGHWARDASVHDRWTWSGQRREELLHFVRQRIRLLQGREVSALRHHFPAPDIRIGSFGQRSRRAQNFLWEL